MGTEKNSSRGKSTLASKRLTRKKVVKKTPVKIKSVASIRKVKSSTIKLRPRKSVKVKNVSTLKKGKNVKVQTEKRFRHEKYETVDKKINTFFALTFILALSLVIGTLIFLKSKNEERLVDQISNRALSINDKSSNNQVVLESKDSKKQDQESCNMRRFNGEAKIHGWLSRTQEDDGKTTVVVLADDLKNLPLGDNLKEDDKSGFTIKIVDANDELIANLKNASIKNPYEFTIKGYALTCENVHLSSIAPGSEAFTKS